MSKLAVKPKLELVKSVVKVVDELGDIVEKRRAYEKREKELKQILYEHGPSTLFGKVFKAEIKDVKRTDYKTELLRVHVMPDILQKCEVLVAYLTCKTERKVDLT
jgi:hypothetical protein